MDIERSNCIAHLNGYLSGVEAVDGEIRQFAAYAYFIPGSNRSPQAMIEEFFSADASFSFESVLSKAGGIRQLEIEIQEFLLNSPLGMLGVLDPKVLDDRRRYVSFRVVELVTQITPYGRDSTVLWRLKGQANNSKSVCTFFCVPAVDGFLVLQFNDDSARIGAR